MKSLIFKTKVTSLEDIDKAETKYDHAKVKEVNVLKDVNEELHVDEIYGSLYHTKQGKGILDKQGTKEITGKTKFANAVVKVYSELGEAQLFPDIQVDENGKFSFDAEKAGFRLQNGETLNFAVVNLLLVTYYIKDLSLNILMYMNLRKKRKNVNLKKNLKTRLHIINYMVIKLSAMMFKVIHQLGFIH